MKLLKDRRKNGLKEDVMILKLHNCSMINKDIRIVVYNYEEIKRDLDNTWKLIESIQTKTDN